MSRAKQIAEMTRIAYETEVFDESDAEIAIDEGLLDHLVNLYNADYRKSQDVAKEIFAEIKKAREDCIWIDPSTNIGYLKHHLFELKVAELEKKYTKQE